MQEEHIESIRRMELGENDRLVVNVSENLAPKQASQIRETVAGWAGIDPARVLVIEKGVDVNTLRVPSLSRTAPRIDEGVQYSPTPAVGGPSITYTDEDGKEHSQPIKPGFEPTFDLRQVTRDFVATVRAKYRDGELPLMCGEHDPDSDAIIHGNPDAPKPEGVLHADPDVISWERGPASETRSAEIYDANGLQWDGVLWINQRTGEGERVVRDADGQAVMGEDGAERERFKAAVPLNIRWKE